MNYKEFNFDSKYTMAMLDQNSIQLSFNLSEFSSRFEFKWSVLSESVVGFSGYAGEIVIESSTPKLTLPK